MKLLVACVSARGNSQRIRTVEEWFDCWYSAPEITCRLDVARTLIQEHRDGWRERAIGVIEDLHPTKHGILEWLDWLERSNVPVEVIK